MKYPILDYIPEERTKKNTMKYIEEQSGRKPLYGVKTAGPLINLRSFDIITGFVPDYMHCMLEGVGPQITDFVLNSKMTKLFDFVMKSFKAPRKISRLSGSVENRGIWKARE